MRCPKTILPQEMTLYLVSFVSRKEWETTKCINSITAGEVVKACRKYL